jgi:phytoene dehydrogenase-like protein
MDCEVVVVGGGIGGLTVAALLSRRGVNVCLLERESTVGGCVASFDKFGYSFEPGYGLYGLWEPDEIHDQILSQLQIEPPEVRSLEPAYVVRLPDKTQVSLTGNAEKFEADLVTAFPECAEQAIAFYRKLGPLNTALRQVMRRVPSFPSASRSRRMFTLLSAGRAAGQILKASQDTTMQHLGGVSTRFRQFIDVQLQTLAQGSSAEVSYLYAAMALTAPRGGLYAIRSGASALAEKLADSIRRSGGRVRLDTPVLRLSYNSTGDAVGVDLLSGETVNASRAIISNLTIWDTYGKLVGLNRTPNDIRSELKTLRGWGAYLLYLGMDEATAQGLVSDHVLALTHWQEDKDDDLQTHQFVFAAAPSWDCRAPAGKRAVTVHARTDVESWFTFHNDETEIEEKDQRMLEVCWERLHAAMPELGSGIEVIDTANPHTFYESTRRKLGMVGGTIVTPHHFWPDSPCYQTALPNLFIVSDTRTPGGIAGLSESALVLANALSK